MNATQLSEHSEQAEERSWGRYSHMVLTVVLAILAIVFIALFVVTSLRRISYPFLLEYLEGGMALSVAHIAKGSPLYGPPSFSFIPYMYAPAYLYIAGILTKFVGPGFFALRLVSFISTLGSFGAIYSLVFFETKNRLAALAGAGFYAALYPVTGYWFDLGRVDSLYVLLILLAIISTRRLHPAFAALLWTLTFLVKQTIAPVALIMLCLDWRRPRRMLTGLATFLLSSIGSVIYLNHVTQGWFRYYVFTVPHANSDFAKSLAVFFPSANLLAHCGIALVVVTAAILLSGVNWKSSRARFYLAAGGSLTALCWFVAAHVGSLVNSTMPIYAMLAVAFGIALARLEVWLRDQGVKGEAGLTLLLLAACVQLGSQLYSPNSLVPSSTDRASQQQLVDWIRSFPGDVLFPTRPYEATLAGKPSHPEIMALHDALRPNQIAINSPLLREMRQAVLDESLDAIVLEHIPNSSAIDSYDMWLPANWRTHYPIMGIVPDYDQSSSFGTKPPYYVFLPCRAARQAAAKKVYILSLTIPPSCAG